MRKIAIGLGCAAMLGAVSTSWATIGVVLNEDFESYSNTSAMEAVWVGFDGVLATEIDDDLDGTPEETGKFAFHPGASVNIFDLASPVVATESEWVRLTVDIYDNATNLDPFLPLNPDNKRMTLGMRSNSTVENIIELGMYNAVADVHFVYRAVLFNNLNGTPNPSWAGWDLGTEPVGEDPAVPVNRFRGGGWPQYIVTVKPEEIVFEFDMDRDGTIDGTDVIPDIVQTAAGFDQLRFGGPSGISSAGGGVTFDNILLEIIAAESTLEGDLDLDGFVGITDLNLVLSNWNQTVPPGDPAADPSGDNFVGIEDLNVVLSNWNNGTPPAAAVPEPATLGLIALGGLAMLRRR